MPVSLCEPRSLGSSPLRAAATASGLPALEDRSRWLRAGLKGTGATAWLRDRALAIPAVNAAAKQADGSLLVRLAPNDYIGLAGSFEATAMTAGMPDFTLGGDNATGLCPVPRFALNAWFSLSRADCAGLLATLCGVDLRRRAFPDHAVAQTIVAQTSAILVRDDVGALHRFHILVEWTAAEYLWDVLRDATAKDETGASAAVIG